MNQKNLPANPCDVCREPGHCCKGFVLTGGGHSGSPEFSKDNWMTEAVAWLLEWKLPFLPKEINSELSSGKVVLNFYCPHLTITGRCGIYETRPSLCRAYKPYQDGLCTMFRPGP